MDVLKKNKTSFCTYSCTNIHFYLRINNCYTLLNVEENIKRSVTVEILKTKLQNRFWVKTCMNKKWKIIRTATGNLISLNETTKSTGYPQLEFNILNGKKSHGSMRNVVKRSSYHVICVARTESTKNQWIKNIIS